MMRLTFRSLVAFMAAIDIRTGEIAWRKRGIAKAHTVEPDGQLLILDEDCVPYLATATAPWP